MVDIVNMHLKPAPPLKHIKVNKKASIDSNTKTLMRQLGKVQEVIDGLDEKLHQVLDPDN